MDGSPFGCKRLCEGGFLVCCLLLWVLWCALWCGVLCFFIPSLFFRMLCWGAPGRQKMTKSRSWRGLGCLRGQGQDGPFRQDGCDAFPPCNLNPSWSGVGGVLGLFSARHGRSLGGLLGDFLLSDALGIIFFGALVAKRHPRAFFPQQLGFQGPLLFFSYDESVLRGLLSW